MTKALRPCLKLDSDQQQSSLSLLANNAFPFASRSTISTHVHFPPTPALTSTHLTHSSNIYDRAPINVSPNACALPERNGRTYTPESDSHRKAKSRAGTSTDVDCYFLLEPHEGVSTTFPPTPFHPTSPSPPQLMADTSSGLDESDTSTIPPDSQLLSLSLHLSSNAHASILYGSEVKTTSALSRSHSPIRMKDGMGSRGQSRSRRQVQVRKSEFAAPELDGCLGGF